MSRFRSNTRRRPTHLTHAILLAATLCTGCMWHHWQDPNHYEEISPEEHSREIEEWRAARLARLTREDGWLTLIGLAWLEEGLNTSGGAPDNRIRIESDRAPAILGTFTRHGDSVGFTAAPGVEVTVGDSAITTLALRDDHHPEGPTILRHATLRLYVIKRGDQLGIRIKDSMSKTRTEFAGLDYFPTDLKWRVLAHYTAFDTLKTMETPSLTGPPQELVFAGTLTFSIDGMDLSLLASIEGDELFLMFGDETSGIETYGAGRQLYTPLPDEAGLVVIDFNKAYNWPCVFSEFATCPLPPKENILPIRVEAGEQAKGH